MINVLFSLPSKGTKKEAIIVIAFLLMFAVLSFEKFTDKP